MQSGHYSKDDIISAIRQVGIVEGDIVSIQVSFGRLGLLKEGSDIQTVSRIWVEAFLEVLGDQGVLLVPTYTYSIGRRELYNPDTTPSSIGEFPEIFRTMPGVVRSLDPMLSTAGIGARAREILFDISHECYGQGSTYDNIKKLGGKICTIGVSLYWATYRHFIEYSSSVPFRYDKLFTGYVQKDNRNEHEAWVYFAAPFIDNCAPVGLPLERKIRDTGALNIARIGRGEIQCIDAESYYRLGMEEFRQNPWLTAKGPALTTTELLQSEKTRVGKENRSTSISLDKDSSALQIIQQLYEVHRDVVSYDYDEALQALTAILPLDIRQTVSGTTVGGSWIVPEAWTCHEAYLETIDGRKVFSTQDSVLHVQRFSQPIDKLVTRQELLEHLSVHPLLSDAVPYKTLHFRREWGLCCSQQQQQQLTDESYRVVIKSEFSFSALTIGECIAAGSSDTSVLIIAHLDHAAQANDGLSGVAVAAKAMQLIEKYTARHYSYRLAVLPENVGPQVYIDYIKNSGIAVLGGVYLDMLGKEQPFLLQHSCNPGSVVDKALAIALAGCRASYNAVNREAIMDNVTRAFNIHGVDIPIAALRRVAIDEWEEGKKYGLLWPEHHSNKDTIDMLHEEPLDEAVSVVAEAMRILEANSTPRPLFSGEPFLTRYNIFLEDYAWITPHEFLRILHLVNGEHDLMDIALQTRMDFSKVKDVIHILIRAGLCT